jgi:short-subunit dehydrogenase
MQIGVDSPPNSMKNPTVLITGCTSGIGLHLAREFATRGHRLVMVAPDQSELESIASDLEKASGVRPLVIARDLERESSAAEIVELLEREGIEVDILANNAGHGFRGKFWENEIEKDLSMINLNINAALRLTKLLLPPMLVRGHGGILNTASVAGFEPGPMLAVYHATKAFVLSWSEALSVELADTGITVTALCPGPTDTDFFPKADMTDVVAFQKGNLMAPQDVARAGYEGLMNGDLFVVPGAINKVLTAGRRVLPVETQAKLNQKQYEKVPANEVSRHRGDLENAAEAD